jgi:hypothetical protein
MKLILLAAICIASLSAAEAKVTVFIEADDAFGSYISAAFVKKGVPATVTVNKESANYILTNRVIEKEESGASKVARCLFAYCAGINGTQTATVQLVNAKTQEVAWGYNVKKQGAKNFQSSAEAIAKHLKNYLQKR